MYAFLFVLVWWLGDIGILWYLLLVAWRKLHAQNTAYAMILVYARLTQHSLLFIPEHLHLAATLLTHIGLFIMYVCLYTFQNKKRIMLQAIALLSVIPNYYNPNEIEKWRLMLRVAIYCFITYRIQKEPGLPISKYIIWSWILFTHEASWVFIPFQIVYDTYNYKINNVFSMV